MEQIGLGKIKVFTENRKLGIENRVLQEQQGRRCENFKNKKPERIEGIIEMVMVEANTRNREPQRRELTVT